MKLSLKYAFTVTSALLCLNAYAENQVFSSEEQQVSLIELYTSEGCSSCPPADKWLNSLKKDPGLWNEFIPLAFHVDYWDYIGWKDQYANKNNSDRQRRYARQQSLTTVYTPGFIFNGKEWRKWFGSRSLSFYESGKLPGKLIIERNRTQIKADFQTQQYSNKALIMNLALVGFGISSEINRGENSGKTLNHDFVVLDHTINLIERQKNGNYSGQFQLPRTHLKAEKYGLVAWISSSNDQTPIQATGGLLEN